MKQIYVVTLGNCNRRRPKRIDIIVRASSSEAAISTARKNNFTMPVKNYATARIADPGADLWCKTKAEILAQCIALKVVK